MGIMLNLENAFRTVTYVDSILTEEELVDGFARGDSSNLFRSLHEFATHEAVSRAIESAGSEVAQRERPYLGPRLWRLYFAFQGVVGRCATLIAFSFEKRSFQSWRNDHGAETHLQAALPMEWVAQLRMQQHYGLYHVVDALKEAFMAEAERQRISLRKA